MRLRQRDSGEEHPLADGMVLGRVPQCQVRLEDTSVSRRHAKVEEREGDLWLVDLGSSNGTLLNGRRIGEFRLRPGDLVTLGAVAFDVVGETPPTATAPPRRREEGAAPRPEPGLADAERARIRAELRAAGRAGGLGDLGQQPFLIQVVVGLVGLGLLVGAFYGIRYLAGVLYPG